MQPHCSNSFYQENSMGTFNPQQNISTTDHLSAVGPDLLVIIIVGFVLIILLAVAAVFLFKFVSRLAYSWRQQRAEEALTRAIGIYNSQEPLEEPDLVHMRPGDQNERWNSEAHRGESEIAFVHSDGRIDRFRPLVSAVSNRRESSTSKKQHNNKSEVKLCSQEPRNPGTYQPMCVKPDSVPARYLGADIGDTVSLGYCDIPPPYEEALEMPVAAHGESAKKKNDQGIIVGSKLETDYYNIEISKQTTKSPD